MIDSNKVSVDFFDVVDRRRSVRTYTDKVVPDEVIDKALDAALKAPNSSNLQPWEFYWVKSADKKAALVDSCLFQRTAKTANHLVVAVSRIDTWKRNRDILLEQLGEKASVPKDVEAYYKKIVPFMYSQDPFGILGVIKWIIFTVTGLFKPFMRGPKFKSELFEVVTKTTALACENFMLAIAAQGYGSCPMEGFDEKRVKKILKLGSKAHVVMVISVGDIDTSESLWKQHRVDRELVVFEI
jgi:nitroreductase